MRAARVGIVVVAASSLLVASSANALQGEAEQRHVMAVEERVRSAIDYLYGGRYLQIVRIATRSEDQNPQELIAQIIRSSGETESMSLVRVLAPPEIRDTAILLRRAPGSAEEAYLYLPSLRATKRLVEASFDDERLFGTDLFLSDLDMPFQGDFHVEAAAESDRKCADQAWILPTTGARSRYDRILSCINTPGPVFDWLEFHRGGETLRRMEVSASRVHEVGSRHLATWIEMKSRIGSTTVLQVAFSAELGELPAWIFSVSNLSLGAAQRDRSTALANAIDTFGDPEEAW